MTKKRRPTSGRITDKERLAYVRDHGVILIPTHYKEEK